MDAQKEVTDRVGFIMLTVDEESVATQSEDSPG
jgi:hypothetical protein